MEQKKTYQMDDAQKASEEYFGGDQLAARVWLSKYALKDSDGNLPIREDSRRYAPPYCSGIGKN